MPDDNVQIYRLLFEVENALRELIIDSLQAIAGPRWYRRRLPPDCRDKVDQGLARDHVVRWTRNIVHHPIYYIDFSDLRQTIEQRDNWSEVFRGIFGRNKDLVTTDLTELEFIRNKVAHNRRASPVDAEVSRAAHAKLTSVLGVRMDLFLTRYTVMGSAADDLRQLRHEGDMAYAISFRGRPIKDLPVWERAKRTWWWFDDGCLGHPIGHVDQYFSSLDGYRGSFLSGEIGLGNKWAAQANLSRKHLDSKSDLTRAIVDWEARQTTASNSRTFSHPR